MSLYNRDRQLNTSGVCSFARVNYCRLCPIPRSILRTGQIWPFPPFLCLSHFRQNPFNHEITHVGPPLFFFFCQTRNFPSLSIFLTLSLSLYLSHSFFLSRLRVKTAFRFGIAVKIFPENSALPLNRTIIYLFMYNENECTLLISSWNKHSKRLH